MNERKVISVQGTAYLFQAVLISLWWMGMYLSDDFFAVFQFPGIGRLAFQSLLLPDLLLIAGLSVLRAYRNLPILEPMIFGAFAFATVYCLYATVLTGGGFISAGVMTLGLGYNAFLVFGPRAFRVSTQSGFRVNALKTGLQIVCVWTLTLVVLPIGILEAFGQGISVDPGLHLVIGFVLFFTSSTLGLWSAFVMSRDGAGTPLPLDQTQYLVRSGPYAFIRNPMAVAGVGQGIAVSLCVESIPVFMYCLLGAVVWQVLVKPVEEADMLERFGLAYEEYRMEVPCWLPKRGALLAD